MTIFNNDTPSGRLVSFSFKPLGASETSRFFGEHPNGVQNAIDAIARGVLDPSGGHVLVIGTPGTGKSFLIEQFASNVDQYLQNTNLSSLHVVKATRNEVMEIDSISDGVNVYLDTAAQTLKVPRSHICVVTEVPEFAASIQSIDPSVKVILELSSTTYSIFEGREQQGLSKVWSSWEVVDADAVELTLNELISTLELITVPQLRDANLVDLSGGEVRFFIERLLAQRPFWFSANEDSEDGELGSPTVLIPPGVWARGITKLATLYAFSSDPSLRNNDGSIILSAAVDHVLDEMAWEFEEDVANDSNAANDILTSIFGGQGVVFSMGGEVDTEAQAEAQEQGENEPIEFSDINTLKRRLKKTVLGQDHAISSVVDSLMVPVAGIHDDKKPVRSFLFLGPTGVGKTQLALSLAQEVAVEPLNVIRLDMSEYAQEHEASKLLGAPSGYVGHEEGGVLTNAVLENPRSIILLDEVEKAHMKIWDSFLQIFDAGRMTDNKGRVVDFTQCIIIMTSNLGSTNAARGGGMGFGSEDDKVDRQQKAILADVEGFFRPELINRIDEKVFFNNLSEDVARKIVRREITIIVDRAKGRGFKIKPYGDEVPDALLDISEFTKYGAREIQRTVFKNIAQPLAKRVLSNKNENKTITLNVTNGSKGRHVRVR